jgi:hypothetical protein
MKKPTSRHWAIVFAASLSGIAMCSAAGTMQSASAADPAASASASASALAAASSSAMAPAGRPKREEPLEPLEKLTIPTEKSPLPKLAEWETAKRVEVHWNSAESKSCRALLVREWLKVKCEMSVGALWLHTGSEQGVAFWIQPAKESEMWMMDTPNGGEVILPLRPGDRRLIQFFARAHDSCIGFGTSPSVMVDETWLEGDPGPTVVLR